ncbi:MAG TPA: pyridoxal phosphate-dependent aminotransferase [Terriglobia bacterium]|nr:pyridoxal phosphate-dependent aminotransferase [Terriglobia bacterium]
MHFSSLSNSLAAPKNPLYRLHDERRAAGFPILDLVKGNVNEHGILYPEEILREILLEASGRSRVYKPDSLGQIEARDAVSAYYGGRVSPGQIVMTPGTSVSYWYCFKLLAEPGDEILTPQPSYPLFDYIARLCGVTLTPYLLDESEKWAIDLEHLERQVSSRTRAIVLISPHNPTGMVASAEQLEELAKIAARYGVPIISDEVFNEFLFDRDEMPRPAFTDAPLVFTLNGFSKMFALPGMKIGWVAVTGDAHLVDRSVSALEMISDTFLPVNETAQFSVSPIFSRGRQFLGQYRKTIADCRNLAVDCLSGCDVVPPAGGFYITVRLSSEEEEAALKLLLDDSILVHPGYFYDIQPNHLVMTFIQDPANLRKAYAAIAQLCRK